MNKSRLEAFSDGVFAIIITIMVLELKIPKSADLQAIKELIPHLYCYVLSFVFIGIYWGNHHHLMHTVKRVSAAIIWGNLHLLFWLSLVPFATGWMGENDFDKVTVAAYGALLLFCGISFTILNGAIKRSHRETSEVSMALRKDDTKGIVSTILYSASVPLALFVNPWISEIMFIIVAIMWIIPSRSIEKALNHEDA